MWQDLLLSGIGIVFTIILIPQLIDMIQKKSSINKLTSSITGIGCFLIAMTDFSLNLHFAGIISLITGIIWLTLFGLTFRNINVNKNV